MNGKKKRKWFRLFEKDGIKCDPNDILARFSKENETRKEKDFAQVLS